MSIRLSITLALAALTFSAATYADSQLQLGNRERVTRLFAYPNNCNVICYRDWTLERTVEHYLQQSVQRDGYADARVSVRIQENAVTAHISGVPAGYGKPLLQLLDSGDLAYSGAHQLNADGKWAFNWYLFLPLGMALENRKSVELLHFPPDYSLTQAQDYLKSNTTDRWAQLLNDNGIALDQTPAYQTIIDIAPIAAPSNAGQALEGVYGYFNEYQRHMVEQVSTTSRGTTLPMVAFGAPVRSWIKQQYGATVTVLGLAQISPGLGQSVAVLGANHPSYIWYAADPANYDGSQEKADAAGLKVMGEDLTAACWQAAMGQSPAQDPGVRLKSCMGQWQVTHKEKTCELFYESIRGLTPGDAANQCKTAPIKARLQQLQAPAPVPATPLPRL